MGRADTLPLRREYLLLSPDFSRQTFEADDSMVDSENECFWLKNWLLLIHALHTLEIL